METTTPSKFEQSNNNPFPVKIGEPKPQLQMDARDREQTLHWLIKKILAAYATLDTKERDDFLARAITKRASL